MNDQILSHFSNTLGISFIYIINNNAPNTEPWGGVHHSYYLYIPILCCSYLPFASYRLGMIFKPF